MLLTSEISMTNTPNVVTETISSTLVINPVTRATHSGNYSCEFSNDAGKVLSLSGLVTVHGKKQGNRMYLTKKVAGLPSDGQIHNEVAMVI